jgi:LAO/AO transport system kinase
MGGVDQPDQINHEMVRKIKVRRSGSQEVSYFVNGIVEGNRTILSQAITLIESSLPKHHEKAQEIIAECLRSVQADKRTRQKVRGSGGQEVRKSSIQHPASSIQYPVTSIRIGITGVPGVGKSTFIEALGKHLTSQGHKLAVLAIDPSSSKSKGSILGDKTRMEELAIDPNAFIRPSPSAGSLGGVTRKTRETIILCEAAGFDVIFVETVGVGQSETAVHSMVDFFLLLMLAGAGDELQGMKRGIIEMADAIFINKADGDNIKKAQMAKVEYTNALHLFPPSGSGWFPPVGLCSSKTKDGIADIWDTILRYQEVTLKNGYFQQNRMEQSRQVLYETIEDSLTSHFFSRKDISHALSKLENDIISGRANPYIAAQELLKEYFSKK